MRGAEMEEIEVNEYVRTKDGEIHKVIEIKENRYITNFDDYFYYRYDNNMGGFKSDIVKHSKQLIDLIEVGDIVRIRTGLYSSFMEFIDNEECLLILKEQVKKFWTIEEILAKELYEANCHKVGGEDE